VNLTSRPFVLVLSAPSGAGKTSLARVLVQRHQQLVFAVSATTRAARENERDGVHYLFLTDAEFDHLLETDGLAEWATVHGYRYGTPRQEIDRALTRGLVPVLDIDVQGARQVRRVFPDAVQVFVLPPSAAELARRLAGRGSEAPEQRRRRLETARAELPSLIEFDYLLINDNFDAALCRLEHIIAAERQRIARLEKVAAAIDTLDSGIASLLERSE
jgi:guanylate kinase